MPILRTLLKITGFSTIGGTAIFLGATRHDKFIPFPADDPILSSTSYLRQNPNSNPQTRDICVRRVPLSKIRPALLEGKAEGKIVEAFCAGVWSGLGYRYQRRYLEKKYRNDSTTAHQLWDRKELRESSYDVGTQITDHFEVVEKVVEENGSGRIVVRCGDSPLKTGVRDSDGLFEMGVEILPVEEGKVPEVEFRLKSVFFKGLGKVEGEAGPMPAHVEFAHRLYTKLWMESAVLGNCTVLR
jgi:hypothetical protein